MAQDRNKDSNENKQHNEYYKSRAKKDKSFQTKVVIRRLPPIMNEEQFLEQVSPVPDHDYFYFVKADLRLGQNAFSRAYVNFIHQDDIFIFKDKFDGYVFVDAKGGEYPAIVEFAPFQKIPKKRSKKRDAKCATIESDPDYLSYLESLDKPEESSLPPAETYLEEIESKEKELRANNGVIKVTTPLIEYLKNRKIEQQKIREEKREERKRKEIEKKRLREEERRRRKAEKDRAKEKQQQLEAESHTEKNSVVSTADSDKSKSHEDQKQSDTVVQVLKNPEREKETREHVAPPQKSKDFYNRSYKDRERNRRDWDLDRPARDFDKNRQQRDRNRGGDRNVNRDKDHSNKDKTEFRSSNYKKYEEKNISASRKPNLSSSAATESTAPQNKNNESTNFAADKNLAKNKRDKSCPGVVETSSSNQQEKCPAKEVSSASEDNCDASFDANGGLKGDDISYDDNKDNSKDPRMDRRIRNKDRPSLEIYRPGMRRFNVQRNSPQKEISTSTSNSSTPSPSPTPPLNTIGTKVQPSSDNNKSKPQKVAAAAAFSSETSMES